ncbi:TPM domain-containing protein [Flavihumibacter sp. UBA7668]|uniref:TPM domain-containing protein n=1 Tax=Flavihumibacter sp. UBA7668 TaxID=1946542 RepID=UPI0025BD72FD|nr:TPM domain-containing protein [Flavihumibacter sp. UBA7668]
MAFFFLKRKTRFFTHDEAARVLDAIRTAEKMTSGEIRVFVESRCKYVNPMDRAAELFWTLQMDHTQERNAVLIYIASKDHQVAIWGDDGIHAVAGPDFWKTEISMVVNHFRNNAYADGLIYAIHDIGQLLSTHFPYKSTTDKNELPDDIIFGH